MARHTTQTIFLFPLETNTINVVADTGTSLTLEAWNGTAWSVDSASPITLTANVNVAGLKIRITPDTGGFFVSDEGVDL